MCSRSPISAFGEVEGAEDEDPGADGTGVRRDGPGGLDAVESRHPHVHQDRVGPVLADQADGRHLLLDAVGGQLRRRVQRADLADRVHVDGFSDMPAPPRPVSS